MEQLDFFQHKHAGIRSRCNIKGYFEGYHLIGIHSVSLYFSFKNISQSKGNNIFYYTPLLFITIPDGSYSLASFNKYISSVPATTQYKVVPSYDGSHLDVVYYALATDKQQDINRVVQAVQSLSTLNDKIYRGTAFCERIKLHSDLFNIGTNSSFQNTEKQSFVIIPIECEPTQHQMYSLNITQNFEFKDPSVFEIFFTDMDDMELDISTSFPAYILFDFEEGRHAN